MSGLSNGKENLKGKEMSVQKSVVMGKERVVIYTKDLSDEDKKLVEDVYSNVNDKSMGDNVSLTRIFIEGLKKLSSKDIERIQKDSLSAKDLIQIELEEYNNKNNSNLSLYEFAAMKMKLLQ